MFYAVLEQNQSKGSMRECVGIISLGCSRNTVDSEKILTDLKRRGALICSSDKASTVLLNTCAFTKEAKQESIDVLLDLVDLKKRGQIKRIIVYGCLVERYRRELKENFKEVDGFFGIADFKKNFDAAARLTPRHTAYLKIVEGCANLCSYCAIPGIKGPLISRKEPSVLREVEFLEKNGVQELNIIGQDISLYGQEEDVSQLKGLKFSKHCDPLVALLKKILKGSAIPWIRLLYLHPLRVSQELLELMAQKERICPYLDVPLQHINDRILKLMSRNTEKKSIVSLIGRIRHLLPQAALRTTFIVGFPSETKKEFQELCDFVQTTRFDRLGALKFSREEDTRAYFLKKQQSERTKQIRYEALMALQKDACARLLKKEIGRILEVMVDEDRMRADGVYIGRTKKDAADVDGVVFLKSKRSLACGSIVRARITDSYEYDLAAEVMP